ncbi:MAG: diaminopimelate epimerase [Lachnospiraceae bacterium]|nr:diaminopimelate epimerase [Lachnospiraceae bacterium]
MKFTKMHGIGNDYVYVDATKEPVKNASEVAIFVSDRHFGIGSDGLILVCPSDKADFRMEMYNADGSLGAMCGNGVRCVGKFVHDHGLTDKTTVDIETGSGIKKLVMQTENGKVTTIRVNMGTPILKAADIPVISENERVLEEPITVDGVPYKMTAVSMGNPHCIIFIDKNPKVFPVEAVGPFFEKHERFPDRINTEFIHVIDEHRIAMRVWERGSGETLACGTGACASAVAGILTGRLVSPVTVDLLGGSLVIEWAGEGEPVYMTGPATEVFRGEIDI